MRRKTLYRCMLVLVAVILLLQGWSMLSVSVQAKEETMEKSELSTIKTFLLSPVRDTGT